MLNASHPLCRYATNGGNNNKKIDVYGLCT